MVTSHRNSEAGSCLCGDDEQSRRHLLLDCPLLSDERLEVQSHLPLADERSLQHLLAGGTFDRSGSESPEEWRKDRTEYLAALRSLLEAARQLIWKTCSNHGLIGEDEEFHYIPLTTTFADGDDGDKDDDRRDEGATALDWFLHTQSDKDPDRSLESSSSSSSSVAMGGAVPFNLAHSETASTPRSGQSSGLSSRAARGRLGRHRPTQRIRPNRATTSSQPSTSTTSFSQSRTCTQRCGQSVELSRELENIRTEVRVHTTHLTLQREQAKQRVVDLTLDSDADSDDGFIMVE